ncbi:MAG: hypothetical protein LUH03_09860 [Oscillospiraceae bacterium]|nr:hypothetical protein [Oscillospiraceae bacterium]
MFIMNERDTEIVNSDYVERFTITDKGDAVLVSASFGYNRPAATMGRYKGMKEARDALAGLMSALVAKQPDFHMPMSRYYDEEQTVKDARTKRRGGS